MPKFSKASTAAYIRRVYTPRAARRLTAAKILPFVPRNMAIAPGTPQAGAELQSWGPDLDWPAIIASNWRPIRHRRLLGVCTLTVPHWRVRIVGCRVMCWRRNVLRVFLPEEKWHSRYNGKAHFTPFLHFLSDEDQRDWEEAAIRAVRYLLVTHNERLEPEPWPAAADDVPF
jgi:hypothetical protein